MARSRNIKPGFFENEDLAECSVYARLLFIGIWTLADREGRLQDRPRKIKYQLLPTDDFDAEDAIQQLANRGFLLRYEVAGEHYLQVVNWKRHQSPHMKEQASTIPAPDMHGADTGLAPDMHGASTMHAPDMSGAEGPKTPDMPGASPVQAPDMHPLDSLIPRSLEGDSVSHETGADAPAVVAKKRGKGEPNPTWAFLEEAGEILGIEPTEWGGAKGRQAGKAAQLLDKHPRERLLACLRWLASNAWQREQGIDMFVLERKYPQFVTAQAAQQRPAATPDPDRFYVEELPNGGKVYINR